MVAGQPRFVLLGCPKQAILVRVVDVSSSHTYREFQGSHPNYGDLVNHRTQFPALGSSALGPDAAGVQNLLRISPWNFPFEDWELNFGFWNDGPLARWASGTVDFSRGQFLAR